MNVLVAVPYRSGTPRVFVEMAARHFAGLTFLQRELAMWPNKIDSRQRYGGNAEARNRMIEMALCPHHTHVLWMDVDLVRVPRDLIERLAEQSPHAAVAPLVYVEKLDPTKEPSRHNGGWFYDTGAFICQRHHANTMGRLFSWYQGGALAMESVGCCYLIPADVYRRGAVYAPVGHEVEHISFFQQARAMGTDVIATDATIVEHAFLPKYGESWDHNNEFGK